MSRLVWGLEGDKTYEYGVDRGVLYVAQQPGVAWNGLRSVTQHHGESERREGYLDGIKYVDNLQPGDFAATIRAFSVPHEFAGCLGHRAARPGMILTGQPRQEFDFSYRTMVNREDYKIHLVYNALAIDSGPDYKSIGDKTEAVEREWNLLATPPSALGRRPTAHLTLDSRNLQRGLLTHLEGILYGTEDEAPRMPTQSELVEVFDSPPIVAKNFVTNPRPAPAPHLHGWGPIRGEISGNTYTQTTDGGATGRIDSNSAICEPGTVWFARGRVLAPVGVKFTVHLQATDFPVTIETGRSPEGYLAPGQDGTGVWEDVLLGPYTAPALTEAIRLRISLNSIPPGGLIGKSFQFQEFILSLEDAEFFDGDTPNTDGVLYSWEGTPNASASIARSWN